jgi:hypothetical protein
MLKKDAIAGRDNQAWLTTSRLTFYKSKEKAKNSAPNQNQVNLNNERITWAEDQIETMETAAQVGAFAITGIQEESNDVDERTLAYSRLSMTHSGQDPTYVTITSARVVDDVIVNAIRIEDSLIDEDIPDNVDAVTRKGAFLKYGLIAIVSLLVLAGMIIPAVVLTRQYPNGFPISAKNAFLEKLKPILTNSSRQELESPGSSQSLALDWLFNKSNFSAHSFACQLQRFAMATFFYSTEGRSWKESTGWLTNADECTWYQSSNTSLCENRTLHVLSLHDNNLNGLLLDSIALLSSLTHINLRKNQMTGTIPSWIGLLTGLMMFDLNSNSFKGTIPLSIGAMSNLTLDTFQVKLVGVQNLQS